jgi:hypothetical protein
MKNLNCAYLPNMKNIGNQAPFSSFFVTNYAIFCIDSKLLVKMSILLKKNALILYKK